MTSRPSKKWSPKALKSSPIGVKSPNLLTLLSWIQKKNETTNQLSCRYQEMAKLCQARKLMPLRLKNETQKASKINISWKNCCNSLKFEINFEQRKWPETKRISIIVWGCGWKFKRSFEKLWKCPSANYYTSCVQSSNVKSSKSLVELI